MMIPVTQDIWSQKRIYYMIGFLIVGGLAAAGWFGYTFYIQSKEQAAYKDLVESIDGYAKARDMGVDTAKWVDIERGFDIGAQRNTSSRLYPYFLMYEADALVHQGKLKEAVALIGDALLKIDRSNSLYSLYALKRALIKMDISDETVRKQGRNELTELVYKGESLVKDMALYYSALDAQSRGEKVQAEKFFKEILEGDTKDSHWYKMAQTKMRLLQ